MGEADEGVEERGGGKRRKEKKREAEDLELKTENLGLNTLGDGDFFVGAEDEAEGFADFAQGGVGFYGVVDEGH